MTSPMDESHVSAPRGAPGPILWLVMMDGNTGGIPPAGPPGSRFLLWIGVCLSHLIPAYHDS